MPTSRGGDGGRRQLARPRLRSSSNSGSPHLQLLQLPLPCGGPRRHHLQVLSGELADKSGIAPRIGSIPLRSCLRGSLGLCRVGLGQFVLALGQLEVASGAFGDACGCFGCHLLGVWFDRVHAGIPMVLNFRMSGVAMRAIGFRELRVCESRVAVAVEAVRAK